MDKACIFPYLCYNTQTWAFCKSNLFANLANQLDYGYCWYSSFGFGFNSNSNFTFSNYFPHPSKLINSHIGLNFFHVGVIFQILPIISHSYVKDYSPNSNYLYYHLDYYTIDCYLRFFFIMNSFHLLSWNFVTNFEINLVWHHFIK